MTNQKAGRGILLCIPLLSLLFFSGCPGLLNLTPLVYTVSVADGITNGTITVSPTSAEEGTAITVTATPNSEYRLKAGSLKYNDGADHVITGNVFTMPAADVTVTGAFEPAGSSTYNITIQPATGGSISASSDTAAAGETVIVTVSPDSGKKLAAGGLKYNGTPIVVSGNAGTFTMPAEDVTITAEFEDLASNEHSISAPSTTGGSIEVPSTGIEGASITVTVTPATGWQLQAGSLKVNNGSVPITGSGPTYTFTMPAANVTLTAVFEQIPYTVTKGTISGNGDISFAPASGPYYYGDTITVTVSPGSRQKLVVDSLKYNGTSIMVSNNSGIFAMPAGSVTITAEFEALADNEYYISALFVTGGSISVPSTGIAGAPITVTVTPNTGYQLQAGSLKYNDGSSDTSITTGGPASYTFTIPAANVTVTAVFEPEGSTEYNVTMQQASGGSISASSGTATAGQMVTLTVTPYTGYRLKAGSLKVSNGSVPITGSGPTYTFAMPAEHVTVTAVFEKIPVPVTGVSVTPPAVELAPGAALTLTAAITPSNADNKTVTWTSGNTNIATVSGSGLTVTVTIKAGAANGSTATITATTDDGGFTDTCVVTVKAGAGLAVNFTGFGDESIDLTLSTENERSNYESLTVTYAGSGNVSWYLDGQSYYHYNNYPNSVFIYTGLSDISLGIHYLTAVIQNGATYASKEVFFRVVE